jgi:hypothetical protein
MSAILLTTQGDLACSWCGYLIRGNSWQALKVRGRFCGKSCRESASNDLGYCEAYPKK